MANYVPYISSLNAYGPINRNMFYQVLGQIYHSMKLTKVTVVMNLSLDSTLDAMEPVNNPISEEMDKFNTALSEINDVGTDGFDYMDPNYELPFIITKNEDSVTVQLPSLEGYINQGTDDLKIEIGEYSITPVLQQVILQILDIPSECDPETRLAAHKLYNQMYMQALQASSLEEE